MRGKPRSKESPSVAVDVWENPRPKVSPVVAVDVLPKMAALWAVEARVDVEVRGKPSPKESLSVAVDVRGIPRSTEPI